MVMAKQGKIVYHTRNTTTKATAAGRSAAAAERVGLENENSSSVKTGTCEKCDKYTNKAEAEKTEEQKYEEEQAVIDRDTKAKLRQQSDDKKMETLPSEAAAAEPKTHIIRLAAMYFDDVASGKKSFELRKNDRGYKEGDVLELMEFKDGRNTGREIKADIIYMLEDYSGLEEGFCILGIKVIEE